MTVFTSILITFLHHSQQCFIGVICWQIYVCVMHFQDTTGGRSRGVCWGARLSFFRASTLPSFTHLTEQPCSFFHAQPSLQATLYSFIFTLAFVYQQPLPPTLPSIFVYMIFKISLFLAWGLILEPITFFRFGAFNNNRKSNYTDRKAISIEY